LAVLGLLTRVLRPTGAEPAAARVAPRAALPAKPPVNGQKPPAVTRDTELDPSRRSDGFAPDDRHRPPHRLMLGGLFVVALWLMHPLLLSSALPAGTDMFSVLPRVRENAHWDVLVSPWSPSVLGLARQTSIDSFLGLLTMMLGNAVWSVKLMMLALLFSAGASAYFLVWKWYRSALSATVAGLLYMTSQATLGRVASGWLQYEALIAAAPLIIYFWVEASQSFTVERAIALALLANGLVFFRQDMFLWLVPYLVLWLVLLLLTSGRRRVVVRNVLATLVAAASASLMLSLYSILPLSAGIRAPWLSTSHVFQQIYFYLNERSLDAYPSFLGLSRDVGYLPFIGQEWWEGHPFLSPALYFATATITVVFAYVAVYWHRDRKTIFLVACAVLSVLLGKGIRAPVGEPYRWAVDHVPLFGSLRGPNRWLIVQALAYSVLAGLTLSRLTTALHTARSLSNRLASPARYAAAVGIVLVIMLPVAPTVLSGFDGWRPEAGERSLMKSVERDRGEFVVASIPYDQIMRFLTQGKHRGYEHDLGAGSALYTGHPALSTDSWDARATGFTEFTASLLKRHDPAFTNLLGAVGVKYLLKFDYPPTAPHLLPRSGESPFYQQDAADRMPNLERRKITTGGTLFAVHGWTPRLTFRTNIAVVLGGRSGLAALADLPGIQMKDWAAFTADDVLGRRSDSLPELLKLIHEADLVLFANESVDSIAVLSSRPLARVGGIAATVGADQRTGVQLTDASVRTGSLADQTMASAANPEEQSSFRLRRPRRLEVWTRVLPGPSSGEIRFTLDGRVVRSMIPIAPRRAGFRWVRVMTGPFSVGEHRLKVTAALSDLGAGVDVDETRIIDPAARLAAAQQLRAAIDRKRNKLAYAFDLDAARYRNVLFRDGGSRETGAPLSTDAGQFWRVREPRLARSQRLGGPDGTFRRIRIRGQRTFYTFARHSFARPRSLRGRGSLLFRYRGTGSGRRYDFIVDFAPNDTKSGTSAGSGTWRADRSRTAPRLRRAIFPLIDSQPGWRMAAFRIRGSAGDWTRVTSVRLTARSLTKPVSLDLGSLGLLLPSRLLLAYPLHSQRAAIVAVQSAGGGTSGRVVGIHLQRRGRFLLAKVPAGFERNLRVIVNPASLRMPAPATTVRFAKGGVAKYSFEFKAPRRGVLVFNQSYDSKWRVTPRGEAGTETLTAFSLVNGFFMTAGHHRGSVRFEGTDRALLGIGLSTLALVLLLGLLVLIAVRGSRRSPGPSAVRASPSPGSRTRLGGLSSTELRSMGLSALVVTSLMIGAATLSFALAAALIFIAAALRGRNWWAPWSWAIGLACVMPVFAALGGSELNNRLAVVAVLSMALAVAFLLMDQRRS
jgi:hypothetical protein